MPVRHASKCTSVSMVRLSKKDLPLKFSINFENHKISLNESSDTLIKSLSFMLSKIFEQSVKKKPRIFNTLTHV